jgi:glycosyltransferase involved in cell wall biosynthesis
MISIAVIMATYQHDDPILLRNAVKSVINQKLPYNYKCNIYIGVDGPVTDEIEKILNELKNYFYIIERSNSNQGLAFTLNNLISKLGDESFIFRMDSDDLCMPCRFERQILFLLKNSDIDILGSDIIELDQATGKKRLVSFAIDHYDALRKISRRTPVAHPTVCFRRSALDIVGFYPNVKGNEDIAMWFECFARGLRFGNIHEPLLQFTVDSKFWSRRSVKKSFSEFLCYVRGTWRLKRFTFDYIYPLARLLLRLSPKWIVKKIYNSSIRIN